MCQPGDTKLLVRRVWSSPYVSKKHKKQSLIFEHFTRFGRYSVTGIARHLCKMYLETVCQSVPTTLTLHCELHINCLTAGFVCSYTGVGTGIFWSEIHFTTNKYLMADQQSLVKTQKRFFQLSTIYLFLILKHVSSDSTTCIIKCNLNDTNPTVV